MKKAEIRKGMERMKTYTITVNGQQRDYTEQPETQWSAIAEQAESRGGIDATLTRQVSLKRNRMTETISAAIILDDEVICAPEIMAEIRG